jgi:hypothetical protein
MPLQLIERPREAIEIAKLGLSDLARKGGLLTPLLRAPGPRHLALSTWHRVFFLGLGAILNEENPIGPAPQLGWRFFVHRAEQIVATADVRRTENSGYRLGPVAEGPLVIGAIEAFEEAARLLKDQSESFEPVALDAPALHVSALLLRTADSLADKVLPIKPVDAPFRAGRLLAVADFRSMLQAVARKSYKRALERPSPER